MCGFGGVLLTFGVNGPYYKRAMGGLALSVKSTRVAGTLGRALSCAMGWCTLFDAVLRGLTAAACATLTVLTHGSRHMASVRGHVAHRTPAALRERLPRLDQPGVPQCVRKCNRHC